jgi:uncharacterized damage-inducible protein DinB
MTPDYIRILIDYNYWARDRSIASAETLSAEQLRKPMGSSFSSVLDTLIHLRYAEWVWLSRWQGTSPTAPPDTSGITTIALLRESWQPIERDLRAFVGSLSAVDLQQPLAYTMMNGQASTSLSWQMIVHLVNHGSYHRGQIATMLRQLGAKPAQPTDMIAFFREQSAVR